MKEFFLKYKKWIIVALIILVAIGGYFLYVNITSNKGPIQYQTQKVQKTTISVSVTGTGQVAVLNKIDIKPQAGTNSAALVQVDVKQGDTVKAGQIIAVVDQKNNLQSLTQARAQVASAQANYAKLMAGMTSQDLAISELSIESVQQQIDNAQKQLDISKANYDTVVAQQKQNVSQSYTSLLNSGLAALPWATNAPNMTATLSGSYSGTEEGSYHISMYPAGDGLYYSVTGLESYEKGPIVRNIPYPIGSRGLFITFSNDTMVPNAHWDIDIPNKQSNNYLANYNAYQNALQSQATALTNAQNQIDSSQQQVDSSQLSLKQAHANLDLKQAPPTAADIQTSKAQIQSAEAQLEQAQNAIANNTIRAPFDGLIAQLNNQVGDQVGTSSIIATLITKEQIAQTSLNEVDVAKIKVGNPVTITFDAIDGLSITGHIIEIDTLGTVSQGVVSYGVKIGFDTQDDRIKPSMSTTAVIITDVKTDVLAAPNAAIKTDTNGSYVQMLDASGKPYDKSVTTGIVSDTLTEITSGLNEGDAVVTQTINPNAKTTTKSSSSLFGGGFGGGR